MDYKTTVSFLEGVLGFQVTLCPDLKGELKDGSEYIVIDTSPEYQAKDPKKRKFRSFGFPKTEQGGETLTVDAARVLALEGAARDLVDGLTEDAYTTFPKEEAQPEQVYAGSIPEYLQSECFSTE